MGTWINLIYVLRQIPFVIQSSLQAQKHIKNDRPLGAQ